MYVEIVSGGQPFTAGRVCLKKKLSFAPWVLIDAACCNAYVMYVHEAKQTR